MLLVADFGAGRLEVEILRAWSADDVDMVIVQEAKGSLLPTGTEMELTAWAFRIASENCTELDADE